MKNMVSVPVGMSLWPWHTGRCDLGAVEVEVAIELRPCRELRIDAGAADEEVESDKGLG